MPILSFVGQGSRDDDNRQANSGRLLNCYREPLLPGGKSSHTIKSVLGMSDFVTIGGATPELFVRDMATIGGVFYVMAGGNLYSVTEAGVDTLLGATVSAEGAMIFGDRSNVCIVSGGRYFLWNGTTMSEPTAGAFSAIGSGVFLGNYIILTENAGRRFQWSDLADASSLPGLNFATAEGSDDNILRAAAFGDRLWLFKERSIEIWYATGLAGANAFAKMPGSGANFGVKARHLVAESEAGIFFIGGNGRVYLTGGSAPQPIPNPAVETAIKQSTPTRCFAYFDEGHEFFVILFSDRPAWCYDVATGEWHERANGDDNDKWDVAAAAKAWGEWFVGDVFGKVYKLERTNADADSALRRVMTSNTLYNGGIPFIISEVEVSGRVGVIDQSDFLTAEPQAMIRFSRDGGLTWGASYTRNMGAQGEYGQRVRVHALGQFRQATMELSISDAADMTINNAVRVEMS
jgi:hypothetical protein